MQAAGCPLQAAIVAPLVSAASASARSSRCTAPGRVGLEDAAWSPRPRPGRASSRSPWSTPRSERLAQAELRALRAQISPHFVYNALAAVAAYIHSRPEEARELLTDFAEFTRYAFRGGRPYVTLADELSYVEKYLRLEQARFGDRLRVRLQVAPEVLRPGARAVLQPLVENAVRHGVERAPGGGSVEILGATWHDVELRVIDDGAGMTRARRRGAGRPRRRDRAGQRRRPAALHLRRRLRAA